MSFFIYYINHSNFEEQAVEIQLQDLDGLGDLVVNVTLEASDEPTLAPAIMESVNNDDDKTSSIKPKRLRVGFNSGEYDVDGSDQVIDVGTFSDGGESRWLVRILTGSIALPFLGNLVLDDNSEAFQPRPNPVQLIAADGLNSLRDVELRTLAGELPVGHYSIADYLAMCLNNLSPGQQMRVIMNLYEVDSNETTSHTFSDIFLHADRFKKDSTSMVDCLTALTWILDAFGCFISYDHDGWWIIRWDEYDAMGTSILTHRAAVYDANDGSFQTYELIDLTKVIAADYAAEYEGYRLSQDNAIRRFQRKANKVIHTHNYTQIDAPCNGKLTMLGAVIDDVIPLKTYEAACWDLGRGFGAHATTPNSEAAIWIRFDANDNENARYLVLTPQAASGGEFNYVRSQAMPIDELDKFEFSFDFAADSDNAVGGPATVTIAAIALHGVDSSVWILGDNATTPTNAVPEWKLSDANHDVNADYYRWFITGSEDLTDIQTYSIESPPAPVDGDLYIHFFAQGNLASAIDDFAIRYNNITFNYIPFIAGTYASITGQSSTVSADNGSRRVIEKEMFISDSPKRLFKGALKKLDGSNYVLTEGWNDFITPAVFTDERLSKFIVYQWWNQYRKTRTVIETDIQGINSDQEFGIPGLIYRWKISHANEGDKFFMLTSLRDLNFRTCGWSGVFVETSDFDGDRVYTDDFEFKFIQ